MYFSTYNEFTDTPFTHIFGEHDVDLDEYLEYKNELPTRQGFSSGQAEYINANEPEYYDSFGMKLNTYTYKNLTLIKDNGRTEKDDETARIIESLVKQGLNIIEEQLEEIQKEKDYQKYNHSYNRYKEYRYTTKKRNRDYSS